MTALRRVRPALLTLLAAVTLLGAEPAMAQSNRADAALYERVSRAMDQAEAGDVAGAIDDLERLRARARDHSSAKAVVVQQLAVLLIDQERYERVRTVLEDALAGAPPDYAPELRYLLAQVLVIEEQFPAALAQLDLWFDHAEQAIGHGLFLAGYCSYRLEDYPAAARYLERAVALTPEPPSNWIELLAFAHLNAGQPERAITLLERQAERFPRDARWWRYLARFHFITESEAAGAASLAVADLVSELDPDEIRRLAQLYAFLGAPDRGARLLRTALEGGQLEADYDNHKLLAELWLLARETEAADRALAEAAELTDSAEPLVRRAELHLQWENYDAARQALRGALERTDEPPDKLSYLLGVAAFNLGDYSDARAALARVGGDSRYAREARDLVRYMESLEQQARQQP